MPTLRQQIDTGAMSRHQWGTVALCMLLTIIDGFDILVLAYTATSLTTEWALSGSVLGLLLSAGLLGMAAGTMFVAPLADKIGRRPLVLICLSSTTVAMFLSAFAENAVQMGILRVITGLGMGGIIVSANVLASEVSSKRWRGLAVSLNTVGYAFGATIVGIVAVVVQASYSWRGVFIVGATMTLIALLVTSVRLPESVDFLYRSKKANALHQVNALAAKMNLFAVTDLETNSGTSRAGLRNALQTLLSVQYRRTTVIICCGFFLTMFGYYFVQSWTPRLLVSAGLSESQGNLGGTLLNFGGMAGAAVLGILVARLPLRRVLATYLAVSGVLLCVFAIAPSSLVLAFTVAVLIGLFVNGCMAGLFTLATGSYESSIRSTATGWATTVGRVGAIVAPVVAGGLVDLEWSTSALYLLMSTSFFAASAAILMLKSARTETLQVDVVVR